MENQANNITVIVETPKGCGHKYEYDAATNQFRLKKLLPAGMVFPFDFGFIPSTLGGDGDPLDVLIISEVSTFPGCVIDCRLVGAFKVEQTSPEGAAYRNDRFLAVPVVSKFFSACMMPRNCHTALPTRSRHFLQIIVGWNRKILN
jgi:inorganic pyrophosphatase